MKRSLIALCVLQRIIRERNSEMRVLFKLFVVAILIALPSTSLGQDAQSPEEYSLPAGGSEQPMALLMNFAEDVASGDIVGGVESGTELFSMAASAVASDPRTRDEGYLAAEQIVELYLEAYPDDLLYHYFTEGGGDVLIKSFSWAGAYWSYHWRYEIHFDDSWEDTEWNRKEAVRHLRDHLLKMADESGSAINVHLATWDGDIDKYLDRMAAEGIPLAAIFSPKQMTSAQLEGLNQAIVDSVKFVPYFGGYVMTFELASGQVLSFTVYGQRELTTTEKLVIIGTPAAGYVAGMMIKVGGKWVFQQLSKRTDSLAQLVPKGIIGALGRSVVNTAIGGTLNRTARASLIAKVEKAIGRKIEVVYGATKNGFKPSNGKIYLRWADDDLIPRGTFFEELQHLIDDANGLTPAVIPTAGSLDDAIFHREVFRRMIDNPLFDISDLEGLNLSAEIRDMIRKLGGQ